MRAALLAACLVACGGASPQQSVNVPPAPTASASASASAEPALPTKSVVHYDDLGISFAVPKLFRVVGDSELESRVNASASAHLKLDLQKHAQEKKGIPLLALSMTNLDVTLSVVVVPADANAKELLARQQLVMTEQLPNFQVTTPLKEISTDGVSGAELESRYALDSRGVASIVRIYVRQGLATVVTAVWTENADVGGFAREALDGLHFTPVSQN